MSKKKPPKWTEVYPQGTKSGDEEQKVFISLARSKWNWRSVAHVAAEAGLTKERVEQILNKYYKKGMVFPNPANADQWGYWERVPHMLQDDDRTIAQKDQDKRIDASADQSSNPITKPSSGCTCGPNQGCSNCGNYAKPHTVTHTVMPSISVNPSYANPIYSTAATSVGTFNDAMVVYHVGRSPDKGCFQFVASDLTGQIPLEYFEQKPISVSCSIPHDAIKNIMIGDERKTFYPYIVDVKSTPVEI